MGSEMCIRDRYEVMDGYESAATWTTNERARQGKRADATAHAAPARSRMLAPDADGSTTAGGHSGRRLHTLQKLFFTRSRISKKGVQHFL